MLVFYLLVLCFQFFHLFPVLFKCVRESCFTDYPQFSYKLEQSSSITSSLQRLMSLCASSRLQLTMAAAMFPRNFFQVPVPSINRSKLCQLGSIEQAWPGSARFGSVYIVHLSTHAKPKPCKRASVNGVLAKGISEKLNICFSSTYIISREDNLISFYVQQNTCLTPLS